MTFESDTEQSDVESIGSRTHICETELGSDEDEEDMYYPDPEGPYTDEPITDEKNFRKKKLTKTCTVKAKLIQLQDEILLRPTLGSKVALNRLRSL